MLRSYRHIKEYEKEILEMRENGYTRKEIAEKFAMTKEQIKGFIERIQLKTKLTPQEMRCQYVA